MGKNGRKMVKKRQFLPFFDIRRFGQLGRIFGRIISAGNGRIFGRIFGIRSYTKTDLQEEKDAMARNWPANTWNLNFHFLHIEKSILFCGNPREGSTNTEFVFFLSDKSMIFKSIMWLKILFVWHLLLQIKFKINFFLAKQNIFRQCNFFISLV